MKKYFFCLLLALYALPALSAKETFQRPPQIIQDLMLARPIPNTIFNKDASKAAILVRDSQFRELSDIVSCNEYRMAGARVNADNFSESRFTSWSNSILIADVASGKEYPVEGIPSGATILEPKWSPDGNTLCFINIAPKEVELYRVDVMTEKPTAEKINRYRVHSVFGHSYSFLKDGRILYKSVPENLGDFPKKGVPEAPVIMRSDRKKFKYRTWQDLLNSLYDKEVYRYLCTSVFALYDGNTTKIVSEPDIYREYTVSPDGRYILAETELDELSYSKKHALFPSSIKVAGINGEKPLILKSPAMDRKARKDSLASTSKWQWRSDCDATLAWVEKKDSTFSIWQCEAPFVIEEGRKCLATADHDLQEIYWGNDNLALYYENSKMAKEAYVKAFSPSEPDKAPQTLFSYSTASDTLGTFPVFGKPYQKTLAGGSKKLLIEGNNQSLLFTGNNRKDKSGDNMWFIDRFDLGRKTMNQVWMAEAPFVSSVIKVLPGKKGHVRFVSLRQSNKVVPQYCIIDSRKAKDGKSRVSIQQVTRFENPVPQLDGIQDRYIEYTRADGVKLTGRLYLPAGYDPAKDGRLPVFMWTYPYEYKCKAEAEKFRTPRYTFEMPGRGHHIFWATQGYAVFQGFSMPVIANKVDGEPNDDFLNQIVMNAEAAIHCLDSLGVADTARVAVGGHSYGSFMTANLMCHTKLFKAGLAESGGFNRSMTPYGFQHEERTYWQEMKMYNDMSPFNYADKLSGHILLVHGTLDENTGTHPVQTERMYYAVAGNGGDADYLQLPYEGHGYIFVENLMQLFHETFEMLEKYLKGRPESL